MICVSLAEPTVETCLKALEPLSFAEIRMDKMSVNQDDVKHIFSLKKKLIATCRPGPHEDDVRKTLLISAIQSGASYVDVELEAPDTYKQAIVDASKSAGCKVIISYHNDDKTPYLEELKHIVSWCFDSGADVAKIACKITHPKEGARLLGLLDHESELVIVGIGDQGKLVRIVAPLFGSLFTYASLTEGKETALGQLDQSKLKTVLETLSRV